MLKYSGFTYLDPVVDFFGLPIDQLNFVATQILGLLFSYILRFYLGPLKSPNYVRHYYSLIIGLIFIYYCYGNECIHIVIMCSATYILIHLSKKIRGFHILVSIFVFSYLSLINFSRMTKDYHTYTLDITGPLMIMTQKLTNLAFSLHDGMYKNKRRVSPLLEKRAISQIPTVLEYLSYCLHFQTLLAGPLCFYKDYIEFIDGRNFGKYIDVTNTPIKNVTPFTNGSIKGSQKVDNEKMLSQDDHQDAENTQLSSVQHEANTTSSLQKTQSINELYNMSALRPCAIKGATAIVLAYFLLAVRPLFPFELNYNPLFIASYGIPSRSLYLVISSAMQRIKYYFAWTCADLVSNVSGLGFNGFVGVTENECSSDIEPTSSSELLGTESTKTENNELRKPPKAKWDLISNIDIPSFELANSLHQALNAWNISTMAWLRHLVYERVSFQRTLSVYAVSALWHGFWPGYYLAFGTAALFTETAKMNRRKYRKFFLGNRYLKFFYDILTFALTRVAMAYATAPFTLLTLPPSLLIYRSMNYWLHALALLCTVLYYVVPIKSTATPSSSRVKIVQSTHGKVE